MYIYIIIYIFTHTHIYVYMRIYEYIYTYTIVYLFAHTHTHTHIIYIYSMHVTYLYIYNFRFSNSNDGMPSNDRVIGQLVVIWCSAERGWTLLAHRTATWLHGWPSWQTMPRPGSRSRCWRWWQTTPCTQTTLSKLNNFLYFHSKISKITTSIQFHPRFGF